MTRPARALGVWVLLALSGCGQGEWPPRAEDWRAQMREAVRARVGPPTRFTASLETTSEQARGVKVQAWMRRTEDGTAAPAYLVLPPDFDPTASYPAVLLLHGHGPGAEAWLEDRGGPERGLAIPLAREGFVVLAPDQRSFGGFRPQALDHEGYTAALQARGEVYARQSAADARAGLGWLRDQPFVDPSRIGVLGQSLGGFIALLLTLTEPEVRATVVSGIFMPLSALFSDDNHACQHFDALLEVGESAELAAAVAPAALQIHFGADDHEFVTANGGRDNALRLLDRWWQAPLAPAPELAVSAGLGHTVDPAAHLGFFRRWLRASN